MKMCHKCSEQELSAFIDGELSLQEGEKVQAHVSVCECCQDRVENLGNLKEKLSSLPPIQLSKDFDVSFKGALLLAQKEKEAKVSGVLHKIFFGWPALAQAAAVVFLSLGLVFAGKSLFFSNAEPYLTAKAGEVAVQRFGSSQWKEVSGKVRLRDGDTVRTSQNSDARIEAKGFYQAQLFGESEWSCDKRENEINFKLRKGNLFVQTGKKFAGNTLVVSAPSGRAAVVGTTFMVRALPAAKTVLSVHDGKVAFSGKSGSAPSRETWVKRLETSLITGGGSPKMNRPLSAEEFSMFTAAQPEITQNKTAKKLAEMVQNKRRLSQQDLRVWQNQLLQESDLELASFGLYLTGEVQEKAMAPAEALQQYVSVLKHFPNTLESAWAFQFLRDRLEMVPKDQGVMGEEIKISDYQSALREVAPRSYLTSDFLKGLEPQRKFLTAEFEMNNSAGEKVLVKRAMTFERELGQKEFHPVGYMDTVYSADTNELLLRFGKLFSYKGSSGILSETNSALFHPNGKLIYTVERDYVYSGSKVLGYQEKYREPGGELLALFNRRVENWNRLGQPLRYKEEVKNSKGKNLLTRSRSNITYSAKEEVLGYEDELVDLNNRVVFETSQDHFKVAVGEQKWVKADEGGFKSMDEVMGALKKMRNTSSPKNESSEFFMDFK